MKVNVGKGLFGYKSGPSVEVIHDDIDKEKHTMFKTLKEMNNDEQFKREMGNGFIYFCLTVTTLLGVATLAKYYLGWKAGVIGMTAVKTYVYDGGIVSIVVPVWRTMQVPVWFKSILIATTIGAAGYQFGAPIVRSYQRVTKPGWVR